MPAAELTEKPESVRRCPPVSAGVQLALDFDRRDRSADALMRQLQRWDCLCQSDRELLVLLFREGTHDNDSGFDMSELTSSKRRIAKRLPVSESAVQKSIDRLSDIGLILKIPGTRGTRLTAIWPRVAAYIDAQPDPLERPPIDPKWTPLDTRPRVREKEYISLRDTVSVSVQAQGPRYPLREPPRRCPADARWRRYQFPWQELKNDDVREGSLELARRLWLEAETKGWVRSEDVEQFLAVFFHVRLMPPLEIVQAEDGKKKLRNNAAAVLQSRVRQRHYRGLSDESMQWAASVMRSRRIESADTPPPSDRQTIPTWTPAPVADVPYFA